MDSIVMMLPFILPIVILAVCTVGRYLFRLYGMKHDIYRKGYQAGYKDGVKRVMRTLRQAKEREDIN